MKDSKTKKEERLSTSAADVHLHVPTSWKELTQEQLRYVLELMTIFPNLSSRIKTYMLIRFSGVKVLGRFRDGWRMSYKPEGSKKEQVFFTKWEVIADMLDSMSFVDDVEHMDVRLERACGLTGVNIYLHDVAFVDYLNAEKAYQGYLRTRKEKPLLNLFYILYRPEEKKGLKKIKAIAEKMIRRPSPSRAELLAAFFWYGFVVKNKFRYAFPNLFRPAKTDGYEDFDIIGSINAQIRALSAGDVTKEKDIYRMDTWRALTELDYKAKEAREIKKMMDKNNN